MQIQALNFLIISFICLLSSVCNTDSHILVLNNIESTLDGIILTSNTSEAVYIQDGENIIHYESEYASETGYGESSDKTEWHSTEECNKEKLITIKSPGTYTISGNLYGQLAISGTKDDIFTLILNGVNITCEVAPGLIFYKAYEMDSTEYEDNNVKIEYGTANSLNYSKAGANIILTENTKNYVTGSHVAKCYKYTTEENGTRTYTTSKRAKYDGAFYSKVSMTISGKGTLYINADNEGLDTEKHLFINEGVINILSNDDGINTNEEGGSVTMINGGTVTINAGLGEEGDGIDSNGYLIINGGTLITAGRPVADSGMDADNGVIINGGSVIAVGSSMDSADSQSQQPAMNLKFGTQVSSTSTLALKDNDGSEIISFCASDIELFKNSNARYFTGSIISHSNLKLNSNYYIYVDNEQYCYEGNSENTVFSLTSTIGNFQNVQSCSNPVNNNNMGPGGMGPGDNNTNMGPGGMGPGDNNTNMGPGGMGPGDNNTNMGPGGMGPGGNNTNMGPGGMGPGGNNTNMGPSGMEPGDNNTNMGPSGMEPGDNNTSMSPDGDNDSAQSSANRANNTSSTSNANYIKLTIGVFIIFALFIYISNII